MTEFKNDKYFVKKTIVYYDEPQYVEKGLLDTFEPITMEEKKIIILDLTDCKYLGELHERIRVAFEFPEWYGANLSAFDDLLWTECDAEELIIIGENTLPKELKRILSQIHRILDKKVKQTQEDRMLYEDIKPFSYRIDG